MISCRAFCIRFLVEGQYKPRTTGSVTFASLRSNVISLFCSKDFLLGWGKWLLMERKVEGVEENCPQVCQKSPDFKTNIGELRGACRNFLKGGLKFWEKYFALTKIQATLFTLTFMSYMLFTFSHINTFLDQVQPRRLFFFPRFLPLPWFC